MKLTPKHQKIADDFFKAIAKTYSCEHKWKPFKEGTVICEFCGKMAKVGFMGEGEKNESDHL